MQPNKDYKILLTKLISGIITEKERWELDRASEEDVFLADALEGIYSHKSNKKPNLSLKDVSLSQKVFAFKRLLVAASVIMLLGFSFLIIQYIDKKSTNIIAIKSPEKMTNNSHSQFNHSVGNSNDEGLKNMDGTNESTLNNKTTLIPKNQLTQVIPKASKKINQSLSVHRLPKKNNKGIEVSEKMEDRTNAFEYDAKPQLSEPAPEFNNNNDNSMTDVEKKASSMPLKSNDEVDSKNDESYFSQAVVGIGSQSANSIHQSDNVNDLNGIDNNKLWKSSHDQSISLNAMRHKIDNNSKMTSMEDVDLLADKKNESKYKLEYKKILEAHFKESYPICIDDNSIVKELNLLIEFSEKGNLLDIDYKPEISKECRELIKSKIIQMTSKNVFKGNRRMTVNYKLRL